MTAEMDPMSRTNVGLFLANPDSFNVPILIAYFRCTFVIAPTIVVTDRTKRIATNIRVMENSSNVKATELHPDSVSQLIGNAITIQIVPMVKTKSIVQSKNVQPIISNAEMITAFQMFGFATVTMTVAITLTKWPLVPPELVLKIISSVLKVVVFLKIGDVTAIRTVNMPKMNPSKSVTAMTIAMQIVTMSPISDVKIINVSLDGGDVIMTTIAVITVTKWTV